MHYTLLGSIVIIFVLLFTRTHSQNCAIPYTLTLPYDEDLRRECASGGTILANIPTKYVESIANVQENPENFLKIELKDDKLEFQVNNSLCSRADNDNFEKTFIDKNWVENIELNLELICFDGRPKVVNIIIPICDENTQSPHFEEPLYNLTIQPCFNHTYQGGCPLNFEVPIVVFDEDRDVQNALMKFQTSAPDLVSVTFSEPIQKYSWISAANTTGTGIGTGKRVYQVSVHLYLLENEYFNIGDTLRFELTAFNKIAAPNGAFLYGKTVVELTFGEMPTDEIIDTLYPPSFSADAYYATVTSISDLGYGSALQNIQPTTISAFYQSQMVFRHSSTQTMLYSMQSTVFDIDEYTGNVFFKVDMSSTFAYHQQVETANIFAKMESYGFLNASVALVVFFNVDDNSTTTLPPTFPTCPPTNSSDCPITSCPTPEPCQGTTTGWGHNTSSTTTTSHLSTSTEFIPTTPLTTTAGKPDPSSTTLNPELTTAETPDAPSTTLKPELTTAETPDAPSTTLEPELTTTETSDAPSTSLKPELTTAETSDAPSTTLEPELTTTETSYAPSTTLEPELTTTETSYAPSTTLEPELTTTETSYAPSTTLEPELTTTETPDFGTDEPIMTPTTPTYDNSSCCERCHAVNTFKCPSLPLSLADQTTLYPDPQNCQLYHMCLKSDADDKVTDHIFKCNEGDYFCPTLKTCTSEDGCQCEAEDPSYCEKCTNCDVCLPAGHPDNICGYAGSAEFVEDPNFCDIFHQCTTSEFPNHQLRDCVHKCATGTVWCQNTSMCDYASDKCPCDQRKQISDKCTFCSLSYYQSPSNKLTALSSYLVEFAGNQPVT